MPAGSVCAPALPVSVAIVVTRDVLDTIAILIKRLTVMLLFHGRIVYWVRK
jgi:hypothetical protein